jgi:tetratricopeptide (TPR) repeat protein
MSETANQGFSELTTDQDFLFAKTRASQTVGTTDEARSGGVALTTEDPLLKEHPALKGGEAFRSEAVARLGEAPLFCALALRPDGLSDPEAMPAPERQTETRRRVAEAIHQATRTEKGFWGLLSADIFGCVLPGKDQASGLAVAKQIQRRLGGNGGPTLTVGLAAYPCLNYARADVLANARKALVHAAFFGPDSRACFDAVSLNISGDRFYDAGDTESAIAEYRQALRLDPRNVNVLNSLGVCFGVRQDYDKALKAFQAAIKLDPDEVLARYNAGLVHLLRGEKQAALRQWLKALPAGPDVFELNLQTGKLLLESDQPEKAQKHIQRAADLKPESATVQRLLGETFLAQRLTEQAIVPFKKALRTNPNDAAALSGLARCYELRNENMEIALSFCRQSVEINPANGRFHLRLGRLLAKTGQLREALKACKQAQALGQDAQDQINALEDRLMEKAS